MERRPTEDANRALADHQAEVTRRQSDHEFKVDGDVAAIARYLATREANDRDRDLAAVVLASELGVVERLPERLQELAPPRAPRKGRSWRAAAAIYVAVALEIVWLVAWLLHQLAQAATGGH